MNLHEASLVLKEQQLRDLEDRDDELVDTAARVFVDEIHTIARAIAVQCGLSGQCRDDFIANGVSIAFRALLRFDPSRGWANNFFYTVLLNAARDLRNKRRRHREEMPADEDILHFLALSSSEIGADETGRLVDTVFELLKNLSTRDRVILCIALRIEDIVPPSQWEAWWTELGVPWEVAREQIMTDSGRVDRAALAELVGMQRPALDKLVSRHRSRLRANVPPGLALGGGAAPQIPTR